MSETRFTSMSESDSEQKKPAEKLSTDEVLKRVFPPEVVEHLKELAEGQKLPPPKDTA
jgi:hypothetical protein